MLEITKEKLVEILTKTQNASKVEILELRTSPGSQKGDNYSCVLIAADFKAEIDGAAEEFHWMFKLPPDDIGRLAMLRGCHVEDKEIKMYVDAIPNFKRLIKERGANLEVNYPNCPYTELDLDDTNHPTNSILVMENLTRSNYRDATNKKKGLGLSYAKVAMEEIAKHHALGYAWIKESLGGSTELEQVKKGKFNLLTRDYFMSDQEDQVIEMFQTFENGLTDGFFDLMEAAEEQGQNFANVLRDFHANQKNVMRLRDEILRPKPNDFNTLCHGDFWFNNILFR